MTPRPSPGSPLRPILVGIAALVFAALAAQIYFDRQAAAPATFAQARNGQTWIIHDRDIALMAIPKLPPNRADVITVLDPGTAVTVDNGRSDTWKRIHVSNSQGTRILAGWILAATVKNATRQP
jgi:hypothetical protein